MVRRRTERCELAQIKSDNLARMERLLSLFHDLQPTAAPTRCKPDPHENLTDILEIVAVAAGIRSAHLQGQGHHDEHRLAVLEGVARRHGLTTLRTRSLTPFFIHRPRRYDPRLIELEDADNVKNQQERPEVLWVYAEPQIITKLQDVVAGRAGVSDVLGYPICCEVYSSEQKLAVAEAYVQGIINTYHPPTADEIVALWKRNVQVQITIDPDADVLHYRHSLRRFPYIQFTACPTCRADKDSPAVRVNGRMRDLAFSLSPSFGRQIWEARDLVINKGRPIAIGRNDPCPCGRAAKFKKCCARIEGS